MSIFVNKELRDLIPPLSEEEFEQLLATISMILSQKTGREIKVRGLSAEDMMKMVKER